MLYSIKLINENKNYNIYPQFKMVDKFTTDLDMFEFTLFPLEKELDLDLKKYNGFVPIVLQANGEDFRIVYLTYYKMINSTYNPKSYKYMFQCTSPTFSLQRITLPNKLITQPITDNKRTVWEELNKIMEVYADNILINPLLEEKMSIPCPELSFTKSTLHEVLIGLFAVCGLAPKMEYLGQLDFIDLKTNAKDVTNWNSDDLLIRVEKKNNVSEYTDAFDYDIENAISDEKDITTQWIAPTSDDFMITKENFIWKLPSDIYEISKVYLGGTIVGITDNGDGDDISVSKLDITKYVIPKEIYDTKKITNRIYEDDLDYKINFLYYENNIIGGGGYNEDNWTILPGYNAIDKVIILALKDLGYGFSASTEDDYRNFLIKVTYKTQVSGIRTKIIRTGVDKPKNTLISNQDDAFIDIVNFGNQKQELIDRTGNELIVGQAHFDLSKINYLSELNIAKLGDRIDNNYIITEREMQFNENSLIINYYLAKDYIFLTGYSGLNQVKRFTSIDTKNTLVRNDNFLYNYKLEKTNKVDYSKINNLLITNYGLENESGINLHLIKTLYDDEYLQDFYILANSQNKIIADSVVCNLKFETNVKAGDSIVKQDKTFLKEPIKYTNNNGEFKNLELSFGAGEYLRNEKNLEIVRKYPRVDTDETFNFENYLINKDNREITSLTLQFRVLSNKDEDIYVYKDFIKYTQLTAHEKQDFKIYCKYYKNENDYLENKYNEFSKEVQGEEITSATITFENNKIKISGVGDMNYYCLLGVTVNDELVLGINFLLLSAIPTLELYLNRI